MRTSSLGSYNVVNAILAPATGLNVRGLLVGVSGATGAITIQDSNNTVTTIGYIPNGMTVLPIAPSAILGITAYGTGSTMAVYGLK